MIRPKQSSPPRKHAPAAGPTLRSVFAEYRASVIPLVNSYLRVDNVVWLKNCRTNAQTRIPTIVSYSSSSLRNTIVGALCCIRFRSQRYRCVLEVFLGASRLFLRSRCTAPLRTALSSNKYVHLFCARWWGSNSSSPPSSGVVIPLW